MMMMNFPTQPNKYPSKFLIFSTSNCTYCEYAKILLENIPYVFISIEISRTDPDSIKELITLIRSISGPEARLSYPQIFVLSDTMYEEIKSLSTSATILYLLKHKPKYIGGFDGLIKYINTITEEE